MSNALKYDQQLDSIRGFIETHEITIEPKNEQHKIDKLLIPVSFKIGVLTFTMQIQDEYDDLAHDNPLLNCVLVLRELSLYQDAVDFLDWCKHNSIDANNAQLLAYYKELDRFFPILLSQLGIKEIDGFVTDLDFQLGSGVMQLLRS